MKEWFAFMTESAAMTINAMALAAIVFGSFQAFVGAVQVAFALSPANVQKGAVWFQYARWLVAGLTFQLAADILETAIAPSWDDIGRLAAIAVIRTFLNYFLERDMTEVRELRQQPEEPEAGQPEHARRSRK